MSAAILVSVYDRPEHLRRCLNSILDNPECSDTELYISSDGPRDAYSSEKVMQVREIISGVKGFKNVISFTPKENTAGNVRKHTWENLLSDHSRYIAIEDDNTISSTALRFFNHGLDKFSDSPEVHAICGYNFRQFPLGNNSPHAIYLPIVTGWGIGLWRDKDPYLNIDKELQAKELFLDKGFFATVNRVMPHVPSMVHEMLDKKLIAGDVDRCLYVAREGQVCVFPSISLVQNWGFDGSGEHCGVDMRYENQTICETEITFDDLEGLSVDPAHTEWIFQHFGGRKLEIFNWIIFYLRKIPFFPVGLVIGLARRLARISKLRLR
jgi:hypothetical protein